MTPLRDSVTTTATTTTAQTTTRVVVVVHRSLARARAHTRAQKCIMGCCCGSAPAKVRSTPQQNSARAEGSRSTPAVCVCASAVRRDAPLFFGRRAAARVKSCTVHSIYDSEEHAAKMQKDGREFARPALEFHASYRAAAALCNVVCNYCSSNSEQQLASCARRPLEKFNLCTLQRQAPGMPGVATATVVDACVC